MQGDLDADYKLIQDIDASETENWNNGQGFNPIGEGDNDGKQPNAEFFTGSFDGQNHTISNLSINRLDDDYVGLFGLIGEGGEVKNVGVINVNITGNTNVGGLVGKNYNGNISNSYSTGNVSGDIRVGGLVGENYGTVSNSYSTGNVTGESDYVGGLVGYNDESVSDSYWDTETSNQSTSAGSATGLTTSEMQGSSADGNMNFDFTDTWSTVTGDYPELQWQE